MHRRIIESTSLQRNAQSQADNTTNVLGPLSGHWTGYDKTGGCVDTILWTLDVRSNSNRFLIRAQPASGANSVSSAVFNAGSGASDNIIGMVTLFQEISTDFWDLNFLPLNQYTTTSYFKAIVSVNRDVNGRPWRMRFALNGPGDINDNFRPQGFDYLGTTGNSFDLTWHGYLPGDNPSLAVLGA